MAKKWRDEAERHAFFLSKKVDKAIRDYNMIAEGDRILVGVSGGKDSLALLELLLYRQRFSPCKYELVAAHVRGDARGSEIELPEQFAGWLRGKGIECCVRDIILPEGEPLPMDCERCGRNRRRTLFEIAESAGCNKVALGHNLEDFAHTALINLFQSAKLETMAFRRDYFGGRFGVIRPLALVREREIVRFAKSAGLPVVPSDCPMAARSKRESAKQLMLGVSKEFRYASANIVRAACRDYVEFGEECD